MKVRMLARHTGNPQKLVFKILTLKVNIMKSGPKQKQFCKRGHDTFVIKRYNNGSCAVCRKDWDKLNKFKLSKRHKCYYKNNKIEILTRSKNYYKQHRDKIIGKKVVYIINRLKTDTQFKLIKNLRNRINQAIKGDYKTGSAVRDLGCSIEFLKQYIESKFYSNMTWDNWGKVWELDHIVPLSHFDLTDREQFLKAVNYTNFQPLIIKDHQKKTIIDNFKDK
jgi:hypothetical protein